MLTCHAWCVCAAAAGGGGSDDSDDSFSKAEIAAVVIGTLVSTRRLDVILAASTRAHC